VDARKAATNLKKYRVTFTEAATVFLDPLAVIYQNPGPPKDEERYIAVGEPTRGRVILVTHFDALIGSA
jgi:uncharacterized protein